MIQPNTYIDLRGRMILLVDLDEDEHKLFKRLKRRAKTHRDWNNFENYWTKAVGDFYLGRGLSRKEVTQTSLWKIAQDLGSRIGIEQGLVRVPDYRDELVALIREKFETRRAST